jgi:hypothetical protein
VDVAKEFVEHRKRDRKTTTLKSKLARLNNLINYLKAQGLLQITCDDVRKSILIDLKRWLQDNLKSCKQGHYAKHIEIANNILNFAVDKEYIKENPLRMSVERGEEEKPMPLKKLDYQKLLNFQTKDKELRIVADSFIRIANYKDCIIAKISSMYSRLFDNRGTLFCPPNLFLRFSHSKNVPLGAACTLGATKAISWYLLAS